VGSVDARTGGAAAGQTASWQLRGSDRAGSFEGSDFEAWVNLWLWGQGEAATGVTSRTHTFVALQWLCEGNYSFM